MSAAVTSAVRAHAFRPFSLFATGVGFVATGLVLVTIGALIVRMFSDPGALARDALEILHMPGLSTMLVDTATSVGAATIVAVVIATLFAWLNERTNARLGVVAGVLPVLPMLVPSIAGAIGWTLLCSPKAGFLNVFMQWIGESFGVPMPEINIFSRYGLIFVYIIYMVPQAYLPIAAAFASLDPALEEASRVSGRGPWRSLIRIAAPAVAPAVASGALLALVYGLSVFSLPLIIGTQGGLHIVTVELVHLLTSGYPPKLNQAMVLALAVLIPLVIVWYLNRRIVRMGHFATITGRAGTSRLRLSAPHKVLARSMMAVYLVISSILPLLALVVVSFQPFWSGELGNYTTENFHELFKPGSQTYLGLRNSIQLGAVCATIGTFVAVIIAWRIGVGGFIGGLFDGVTKLPATISHIVVAAAVIAAFAGPPLRLHATLTILIIGYLIIYLPQAMVNAQAAYARVGPSLIEASLVSGESPGGTFRRISMPLMRRGVVAGWAFLFALVIGDITATAILASTRTPAIGSVIFDVFQNGTYPVMAALAVVITAASATIVLSVLAYASRGD